MRKVRPSTGERPVIGSFLPDSRQRGRISLSRDTNKTAQRTVLVACGGCLSADRKQIVNRRGNIVRVHSIREKLMNDPATSSSDQTSFPMDTVEMEFNKLVKHETATSISPLETNAERIRSSLARLSSSSVDDLEALTAELKRVQDFLKSEVDSVQRQIQGALAGINIIIETIVPWKNVTSPQQPTTGTRAYRAGPAAGIEVAPPPRRAATGG
jgi:hypothetical protein